MYISTAFNPLIAPVEKGVANGWLEALATTPNVVIDRDGDVDAFVSMFDFENVWDASQQTSLRDGMKRFEEGLSQSLARTFELSVHVSETQQVQVPVHVIATEPANERVETALRGIFEQADGYRVDAQYCFPNIRAHISRELPLMGWLEARAGAFVFLEDAPHQRMQSFLKIPTA